MQHLFGGKKEHCVYFKNPHTTQIEFRLIHSLFKCLYGNNHKNCPISVCYWCVGNKEGFQTSTSKKQPISVHGICKRRRQPPCFKVQGPQFAGGNGEKSLWHRCV